MTENKKTSYQDYSDITSEGSIEAFRTSRVYHTEHHLPYQPETPNTTSDLPRSSSPQDQVKKVPPQYKIKKRTYPIILLCLVLLGLSIGAGIELTRLALFPQNSEVQVKYVPQLVQYADDSPANDIPIADIANNLKSSVVAITNESVQQSMFGMTTNESTGSGVIFDISSEHVYILTNNHVIENANTLTVSFFGNQTFEAQVIGADPDTDLAVITIDKSVLPDHYMDQITPVILGDSDDIAVGETAIAIGNPLGYNYTVTVGVISAVNRFVSSDLNALSLIQTDAAINPGNSGGALVNTKGQLIGINTIKISDTSVEGIGFGIPINSALPVLEELIDKGYVSKPFIGIYGRDLPRETAKSYGIQQGVVISDFVPHGPAIESDLVLYDMIIEINGVTVENMNDLTSEIGKYDIGDTIQVTVIREIEGDFVKRTVDLTVGDRYANDHK